MHIANGEIFKKSVKFLETAKKKGSSSAFRANEFQKSRKSLGNLNISSLYLFFYCFFSHNLQISSLLPRQSFSFPTLTVKYSSQLPRWWPHRTAHIVRLMFVVFCAFFTTFKCISAYLSKHSPHSDRFSTKTSVQWNFPGFLVTEPAISYRYRLVSALARPSFCAVQLLLELVE